MVAPVEKENTFNNLVKTVAPHSFWKEMERVSRLSERTCFRMKHGFEDDYLPFPLFAWLQSIEIFEKFSRPLVLSHRSYQTSYKIVAGRSNDPTLIQKHIVTIDLTSKIMGKSTAPG